MRMALLKMGVFKNKNKNKSCVRCVVVLLLSYHWPNHVLVVSL